MINFKKCFRKPPILDNTIWVFGCSFVWGELLEEQDTIPYILQELTGFQVDNLGIQGGSPDLVHDVLVELLKTHTPRAVIIAWPRYTRTYTVSAVEDIIPLGPWIFDSKHKYDAKLLEQYKTGLLNDTITSKNLQCIHSISSLLSCPYYSFRFLKNVKELIAVNNFVDFASDGRHPGPISNRLSAGVMADWVNTVLK